MTEVQTVAQDAKGNVFTIDLMNSAHIRIASQGYNWFSLLLNARSIAVDADGNVYGEDAITASLSNCDSHGNKSVSLSNVAGLFDFGGVAVDWVGVYLFPFRS